MYETAISWLIILVGVYAMTGVLVAIPPVIVGLRRIDPAACGSSWMFHVIVVPGIIAFWPLLMRRWLSGRTAPPVEKTAHKLVAE